MQLSVIIPTLNEQRLIARQVEYTAGLPGIGEVVVADGGSTDDTLRRVPTSANVIKLSSAPGRAAQMNAGAKVAQGDVLLFLHADVTLPENVGELVEQALEDQGSVGGAFVTWTVGDKASVISPLLHLADLRSRYTTLPYGDQAIFVRRESFERLGGFPDQPLMEDLEFSLRLGQLGRIRRVPVRVIVSGRRFINRPFFYALLMNLFPLLYRWGVPPERLAQYYREIR